MSAQKRPTLRLNEGAPNITSNTATAVPTEGRSLIVTGSTRAVGRYLGPREPFIRRSRDGGRTWEASVRLNPTAIAGTDAGSPRIHSAGSTVDAVWSDNRNGADDVFFRRSQDGGSTWGAERRVNAGAPGASLSIAPDIAVSGNTVHVAWGEVGRFGLVGVRANRSRDGGATWWPSDVDVSMATTLEEGPFAMATDRVIGLAWTGAFYETEVYFNRSVDGGLNWMPQDACLSCGAGTGRAYGLNVLADGNAFYAVWCRDGAVFFNRSLDAGATWLGRRRIDLGTGGLRAGSPAVAVSGTAVFVGFATSNGQNVGEVRINRSLDQGTSWLSSTVRVDAASQPILAHHVTIAARAADVFVAWEQSDPSSAPPRLRDIFYNRSTDGGLTWRSPAVQLDEDATGTWDSSGPSIVAAERGLHAVWQEDRTGTAEPWVTFIGDLYHTIALGAQHYGVGSSGSGGVVPRLDITGLPLTGASFALDVTAARGNAPAVFAVGIGPSSQAAAPFAGGTLFVEPAIALPVVLGGAAGVAGAGTGQRVFPVPDRPSLRGINLNAQGVVVDPGAPQGLALTEALEIWID
ncbi:MAG: sialidase family protein [Planctomycetota bacterium]